ncbi:glycoside hydrolase family 28 protein [Neptunicella marina]|uniref:Glycoside hydrolase family 28 protein n=1 Tax=Neptunicella marina TaxID=2125989 RepID=A0A8J6M1P6_9ALTE|nr:glycoside hydrolase family 28 protein [Neptunicella marina]MBC3765683.1 glycoside hydrolase family 28 protein [Neptunicella marina]
MIARRTFIKSVVATAVAGLVSGCGRNEMASASSAPAAGGTRWKLADEIRRSVRQVAFADQEFVITDFGAKAESGVDNTQAIKQTIEACHQAGGGRVVVPAGRFETGAVHLLSNVNLHLQQDATLAFLTDPAKYLPAVFTRWEGMEMMGYSPLIYAFEQTNVAVTGTGTLDGQADDNTWWPWKGKNKHAHWRQDPVELTQKPARDKLQQQVEAGIPPEQRLHAEGSFLRPAFFQPYRCHQVLIEGVTIVNSPFWLINPVLSEDVTVRGVTCRSHGPNNDGCDPESCNRVLIEDCLFDTGDDCIAIKSGRNADGRRVNTPCQNILVENCQMKDGHGGLVIGSEISGGARNIFMQNCHMSSPELERAIRIKTNSIRGGVIENINVRNVDVGQVKDAIVVNFYYEEGDAGSFDPVVRDIHIEDFTVEKAKHAMVIRGFDRAPIENLLLRNCRFNQVAKPQVVEHVNNITLDNVWVADKPLTAKDLVTQ